VLRRRKVASGRDLGISGDTKRPSAPPKGDHQCPIPLEGMGLRFQKFAKRFEKHFWRRTRSVATQAWQYLQGLMQARRKNMERMEEVVPDCDYQSLQHFLSDSDWDARAVLDQVAVEADRHLGGSVDSCLLIDESSFQKKGEKSSELPAMVRPTGQSGQLSSRGLCCLGARVLFDPDRYPAVPSQSLDGRCEEVFGRPVSPKLNMALKSKADPGFRDGCAGSPKRCALRLGRGRCGYGQGPLLLRRLADQGETFLAEVHKDQLIYLQDPRPCVPERKASRGRKPTSLEHRVPISPWRVGASSACGALAESRGSSWHPRAVARGGVVLSCVAVGMARSRRRVSGTSWRHGDRLSREDQVLVEQCCCADLAGEAGANAAQRFWIERSSRMPRARAAWRLSGAGLACLHHHMALC